MTRTAARTIGLAVALALIATTAAAQVNTLQADNPRENSRLKFGPFYLTPNIELRDLGIDSNVFNDTRGNERSDITFTVTPRMRVWLPVARRALLRGVVATDLVWYRKFSSERSVDPRFDGKGEIYFRRFTLFADGSMLYSRQRPTFDLDLRTRRRENAIAGGVDFRITPKVTLELQGRRASTSYGDDRSFLGTNLDDTLGQQTRGVSTTGRYRATALTTFAVRAERFEERFAKSPERDSDSVRVMPGVEFRPRALLNGSAYLGFRHLNPIDESVLPEFAGFVSDLALSYTLLGATSISVNHSRDVRYSYEPLQPYFVSTAMGARVRQALGPKFDAILSAERSAYAYRELGGEFRPSSDAAAPLPERIDTTSSYGASLGYRLGRRGRIGAGGSYWRRDSTTREDREFAGLRFGATLTYGI